MSEAYLAEHAWLPDGLRQRVRIAVESGRITEVVPDAAPEARDVPLAGLTLSGFANTHSHAFHRALRGRTHEGGGTFWTWREQMYSVAARLDPENYYALARATFAEMAVAGVSAVGEFHYVHHRPDGGPYADPNAMGIALLAAARDAGIRITLLDTCYLSGGLDEHGPVPLAPRQLRFGDGDTERWAARVAALRPATHALIGAAIHSVRGVPRDQLPTVVAAAAGRPLHVHLSEQPDENTQCVAAYGMTPTALLADAGALGAATTAVHATHLSQPDIVELGNSRTSISFCPTTERDLADGIGPARALADAGSPIVLGSDQHAMIDLLEEARAVEMDERLATQRRGRFRVAELVTALTAAGQSSLGWTDAGHIAVGARADLTTLRLDSVRTAGAVPGQAILAASAADVHSVIVDGIRVVQDGVHVLGDVGLLLREAIAPLVG
ncbi:MAG TPA: formimidoylglutamate deiminase [Jatrophihabitantaceae bacterium]|nr:formimidoylglutamate deiminase [Jatrophihabitantaceae bacterium]